jgi:hypothetical protein
LAKVNKYFCIVGSASLCAQAVQAQAVCRIVLA